MVRVNEPSNELQSTKKKAWRRVLYEKQPYKDNYYDPDKFFGQLTVSTETGSTSYLQAVILASLVVQQFSSLAFFFVNYKYLLLQLAGSKDPSVQSAQDTSAHQDTSVQFQFSSVSVLNFSLLSIGMLVYSFLSDIPSKWVFFGNKIKVGLIFLACLRLAAPVLQTLTLSFSEDTIYALCITFSTIHLAFHDYAYVNGTASSFSGTISLNAAIFTAILLASRLQDHSMVMGLVLLAVMTFALFPVLARVVKMRSLVAHGCLVSLQFLTTSWLLFQLQGPFFTIYVVLVVFLWVVAPWLFVKMQMLKMAFHGPWDVSKDI